MREPRASLQFSNASDTPMSAAAGIVVTEMKTPMSAPVRASTSETTPTIPASDRDDNGEHVRSVDQVGHRADAER